MNVVGAPASGEVLDLVICGRSNTEIADALVVSQSTVKTHLGHILDKLGLRDRVQAVVFGYENGLVEPGAGRGMPRREEIRPVPGALLIVEARRGGIGNGQERWPRHGPEHSY